VEETWEFAALGMPTILRWKGYKFFFFSLEEDRPHIHVTKQNGQAKVWLDNFTVAKSQGFSQKDLNVIQRKVEAEYAAFLERWNDYFIG